MFEVYAFLAMFTVQIIVLTVVHPAVLIRRVRMLLARYPAEQFPQLYRRGSGGVQRTLAFYRLLNTGIAVVGLVLLGWLFTYMRRPDWDDGPVEALVGLYFALQLIPLLLCTVSMARDNKILRNSFQAEKRTATLQRRGLLDFVSPVIVFFTVLCYPLFVALVIYIQQDPFPGFAGYFNIGIVTLLYALTAVSAYTALYGRKSPLQTHADRMRTIEVTVKICVYSCLAGVVFLSLNFTLVLLDLQSWEPLAQSFFLVICALLYSIGLNALPSQLRLDGLRSTPVS